MLLPTRTLLLFLSALLLATLAHALPGGGGVPKPTAPPMKPNERATWLCTHKYKVMYSHYKLEGRDWNKTEKEIRIKVEAAGMTTRWEYDEFEDENGIISFESSVSLKDSFPFVFDLVVGVLFEKSSSFCPFGTLA